MAFFVIDFEAEPGTRILNRRFMGITTFPKTKDQHSLWWSYETRKWDTRLHGSGSTHAPCSSYKAFLRHIRKHSEELKGYDIVLVSRFHGYNIAANII